MKNIIRSTVIVILLAMILVLIVRKHQYEESKNKYYTQELGHVKEDLDAQIEKLESLMEHPEKISEIFVDEFNQSETGMLALYREADNLMTAMSMIEGKLEIGGMAVAVYDVASGLVDFKESLEKKDNILTQAELYTYLERVHKKFVEWQQIMEAGEDPVTTMIKVSESVQYNPYDNLYHVNDFNHVSESVEVSSVHEEDTTPVESQISASVDEAGETNEETSTEIPAIGGSDYTFLRKYIDEVYNIQLASEVVGREVCQGWVDNVYLKRTAEEQEGIPPIYQIIVDLEISKEDLIQKNNENGGIYLSAETIDALYQEDIEEVKKSLMSPFALYYEGEIYTYDEFAETHVEADIPAETHVEADIPAETLDEYFDFIEKVCEQEGIIKYMWESIDNTRKAYGLE